MERLYRRFSRLPIKLKLTLWSSLLLSLLFIFFNGIEYNILRNWMTDLEEQQVKDKMSEIQAYFSGKENPTLTLDDIQKSRYFIEQTNEKNELIRILDRKGNVLLSVSDQIPENFSLPMIDTQKIQHIEVANESYLVFQSPIQIKGFEGTIEIIQSLERFEQLLRLVFIIMVTATAGAVLLSIFGGMWITRQMLSPVKNLSETMNKIKREGMHERVETRDHSHDELTELSQIFNEMMDELEKSFKQQKQFVEDASHELRTPISVLEGHLSMLNRWGKKDPAILEESISASIQETQRLKHLVMELLELTRVDSERFYQDTEALEPEPIIAHLVKNFKILYPQFHFFQDLSSIKGKKIRIKPQHFEQVLTILLDNAVKYSGGNNYVNIQTEVKNDRVLVTIVDEGIGIPKEDLQHIFERFYRVDKARSRELGGNGLGLAIAKQLVERYQGMIQVESTEGEGTSVTLQFQAV
ncbi:HAMP domain-containing histidine kinase [Bacillus tianshenii]|nr:HAMP domain-containing histidine kinase [Bacillus tianshenii]